MENHATLSRTPVELADHWKSIAETVEKEAESSLLARIAQAAAHEGPALQNAVESYRVNLFKLQGRLVSAADGVTSGDMDADDAGQSVLAGLHFPNKAFSELNFLASEINREVAKDSGSLR